MNPKDFQGIYKWKFLIPIIYIINWVLIIIGPLFFPFAYQIYCMVIISYSTLKTLGLCLGTFVSLIMLKKTLNILKQKESNAENNSQILHAIVIPSYKQDEQVLLDTLKQLSLSKRAKNHFLVFLAMEAHQDNCETKAKSIIQKMKSYFFNIDFTQHKIRDGQAKGKASNVSWCVQHMQQKLAPLMIDINKVIVTIIDADSWAPKQYFQMVQLKITQKPEIKDFCIFSAPQIYTRNHLEVPVFNRTFDTMHSLVQLANLVAVKFSFPLSNYSLSYNLAKRIGWWDTCADAIGEDFHTCQKSFWKTQESMYTCAIYVPFNQVSLSTGQGYCKDIAARFWQAQRHTLGVSDVAYSCHMLFNTPFRFRNLWLTGLVIEVFGMAAVIPWSLLGLSIQYKLMNDPSIQYFPGWLIQIMLNGATFFTFFSYIFYEAWKRIANKQIYGKENDAWWRVFQYPIIFTFALFGFSIPSFIMASFSVLCITTQYRVAEKRLQKKQGQNVQKFVKHKSIQKKGSLMKKKSSLKQQKYSKDNRIINQYTSNMIKIDPKNVQDSNVDLQNIHPHIENQSQTASQEQVTSNGQPSN